MSSLKGKKILVTGGAGFIGSHLTNKLVSLGARVSVIVKYNSIIEFNGVNFFGEGIYEVKGSQYRFLSSPHYKEVKNSKILL